ncbi:MAG: AraC family transcriptional regulator [Bacteroidia bacterium]|nr:AraC family transcriptional regulator [Bacteroidia bacterium]
MVSLVYPTVALSPYVISFAVISRTFETMQQEIISARGVPMLMFPFKAPSDTSFIHGLDGSAYPHRLLDSPALLTANSTFAQTHFYGEVNFVMVLLQMTGAYHFLRGSVKGMADQVNLLRFYGNPPDLRELQERLWDVTDKMEACTLVETYLLRYFSRKRPTRLNDISPVTRYLMKTSGQDTVETLRARFKCSERWLQEQFAEQTSLSPKNWLRLLRFRAAASYWLHHPGCSWFDLVVKFGYTDPSHLNRDFQQYAGSAPARHFARYGELEARLGINEPGMFGTGEKAA